MAQLAETLSGKAISLVEARQEDATLILTLNSPPANSLSIAMMEALLGALERARDNDAVRAIIITHEGKVFCAGHDLKEMTAHRADDDRGREFFARTMGLCSRLMQTIVRHPKPVIAAVGGVATAAGCQLVASCDLAVAGTGARFATPGVNIGLFCSTPMVALSRNVSRKQAMEMLLTGEMIDAETAHAFGLVNRVVAPDEVNQTAMNFAQTIASKSPLTLKIGKEAFYEQAEMGLGEAYEYTARVMVENMLYRDAEEGIGAFIEKREPIWKGE